MWEIPTPSPLGLMIPRRLRGGWCRNSEIPTSSSAYAAWLGRIPSPSGRAKVGRFGVYSRRKSAARRLRSDAYSRVFSTGVDFPGVLITQRSKVQILPPQPLKSRSWASRPTPFFFRSSERRAIHNSGILSGRGEKRRIELSAFLSALEVDNPDPMDRRAVVMGTGWALICPFSPRPPCR